MREVIEVRQKRGSEREAERQGGRVRGWSNKLHETRSLLTQASMPH